MSKSTANPTLADVLDRYTAPATLVQAEGERWRCLACGHRCLIGEGKRGICKVRFVQDGQLRVPFGYVAGLQCDPVEKKPFYHVHPGGDALTFGMLGCDFHCGYCQNWITSQALRNEEAGTLLTPMTPRQIVAQAVRAQAKLVVSSYNEPLITAEWAAAVFQEAHAAGLDCAVVSNGNATAEALAFLAPWLIAYKVDLKSFNDRPYRQLGGKLEQVTDTIRQLAARHIWVEVVTLLVPGFNDDEGELRAAAQFLASVSRDIPWHLTAFHPDYQMQDTRPTSVSQLLRAAEIGSAAGLNFVYLGNLPGSVEPWENTHCPNCQTTVIERFGFYVLANELTATGHCPKCHYLLPGRWHGSRQPS